MKRTLASIIIGLFIVVVAFSEEIPCLGPSVDFSHGPLKVSDNGRYLMHDDGAPVFYMGDTAWELFHRANKDEAERYLENRRQKGFTVIQAVCAGIYDGYHSANANGDKALIDNDPTRPNEAYFRHVDDIVALAKKKGIVVGFLPCWGDRVVESRSELPALFDPAQPERIRTYGRYLGRRYKNSVNLIWILGGDSDPYNGVEIWGEMVKGIKEGEQGGISHLITYHPQTNSAEFFHRQDWLNFNMMQSGHGARNLKNYETARRNLERTPTRPTIDGEPNYEDHPVNWDPNRGWFDDYDVRKLAYWSVFAGACGHTYGCNDVWQLYTPERESITSARTLWTEAMDLPGAWDMLHLRTLVESRPYFDLVPDLSLIVSGQGEGGEHIQACRGKNYAYIYIPTGKKFTVQMGKFEGQKVNAKWFDPRTGEYGDTGKLDNQGTREFTPPQGPEGRNDWVLVLESADHS